MKLRLADQAAAEAVAKLYVDGWRRTYRGLVPESYLNGLNVLDATERWIDFLQEPGAFLCVAEEDGRLIGFAAGRNSGEPGWEGELYALYQEEGRRGTGLGKALFTCAVETFFVRGQRSMLVWAMEANKQAVGFYRHMGGVLVRRRANCFGDTTVTDIAFGWPVLSDAINSSSV